MTKDNKRQSTTELSRRAFNIGLGVAGAAALVGMSIGHQAAMAQGTPKKGGRILVAGDSTSAKDSLDPAKATTFVDYFGSSQLYNRLVDYAPDGKLVPALAESWESNKAGDEWVFKLRQGVTFHNGKTLTAQDVVYTLNRVLDPATASGARAQLADMDPKELKAEDARTVRTKLTAPNADLAALLTAIQFQIVPDGHTDFMKPVGTGPFSCKSFEPGLNAQLVRNPNYWRGGGRPYLDEIEVIGIPDPTSRFNALLAGNVQAITKLSSSLMPRAQPSAGVEVFATPGGAHASYPMRCDAAPFDSVDVRLAMKYAVDRKKLLELAYGNMGVVANDQPVPASNPFYCADIPAKSYDPDKVKFHLKKAGHENTTFELFTTTAVPNGVDAATVYAEMANKAGAKVKVSQMPADGYWGSIWLKRPWAMGFWWGRPTADLVLSLNYASDAKWNEGAWKNPKFDQILKDARATTDTAIRKRLYCDAQRMVSEEGPTMVPVFSHWLDAKAVKLKGIPHNPLGSLGFFYFDDVYLDA